MRKFFLVVLAVILSSMLITSASAQEMKSSKEISDITGRVGIGYNLGWVKEHREEDEIGRRRDIDLNHSLNVTYGIDKRFALRLEGGYGHGDGKRDSEDEELYSLYGDVVLREGIDRVVPYAFLGAGFQNYNTGDLFKGDKSFSGRAGVGLEYFVSQDVVINGEGLYFEGGNDTLDGWQVRGGIKFYLPSYY
ncbi:MAG: outer membrane beta-barrel protein [bacterium]